MVGRYTDALEDEQAGNFINSLKQRLVDAHNPPKIPKNGKAKLPRGRPVLSNKVKAEPTTQRQSQATASPYFGSSVLAGPSRNSTTSVRGRAGRPSLPISVADSEDDDARERARRARAAAILGGPAVVPSRNIGRMAESSEDEYGFVDPNESFFDHLDEVEATATQGYSQRNPNAKTQSQKRGYQDIYDTEEDEDYGFNDDSFLAGIDETAAVPRKSSRTGTNGRSSRTVSRHGSTQDQPIEISD